MSSEPAMKPTTPDPGASSATNRNDPGERMIRRYRRARNLGPSRDRKPWSICVAWRTATSPASADRPDSGQPDRPGLLRRSPPLGPIVVSSGAQGQVRFARFPGLTGGPAVYGLFLKEDRSAKLVACGNGPGGRNRGAVPAVASARHRGPVDPHHPRGGRRVRAAGAAVLGRQGLGGDAPAGPEGLLAGADPVPGDAHRHRPQLPRGARVPRPDGGRARSHPGGGLGAGVDRRRRVGRGGRPDPSRNRLQTRTLLDAIAEHRFDAVFGGARRDEEKARAKERVYSFRDEFGQWDPKNQRPELWSLYNGRHGAASTSGCSRCPTGPSSTSGSTWARRSSTSRHLLRPPPRGVPSRRHAAVGGSLRASAPRTRSLRDHRPLPHGGGHDLHRCRRVHRGDGRRHHPRGGRLPAHRAGATRADDRVSEAAMEDRKREGYF